MKNQIKTKSLIIIVAIVAFVFSFKVTAGSRDSSGSFAYSKTSALHLKAAQIFLITRLQELKENELFEIGHEFGAQKLSRQKLSDYIRNLKYNYFGEAIGKNPQGEDEPKDFNYHFDGPNGPYIEALALYFISYNRKALDGNDQNEISRRILHEAAHLFNIMNDQKAYGFSEALLSKLMALGCGLQGSLLERVQKCSHYVDIGSEWKVLSISASKNDAEQTGFEGVAFINTQSNKIIVTVGTVITYDEAAKTCSSLRTNFPIMGSQWTLANLGTDTKALKYLEQALTETFSGIFIELNFFANWRGYDSFVANVPASLKLRLSDTPVQVDLPALHPLPRLAVCERL